MLFVQDRVVSRNVFALVLDGQFDVIATTRGHDGYDLACTERPDAVVVDASLPDIDGLRLCERLRATPHTASIPLLLLAGDDVTYARALKMPSLDVVRRKPCPADELLASLLFAVSIRQIQ